MTTAPTPSRADALIREHRASMHPETLRAWASDAVDELGRLQAAERTLHRLGCQDRGGQEWAPPIGQPPDFDLIDSLRSRIAELEVRLVAEALATAEHKLRADQLTQQHRMQAQMHAQATQQLAELEARKPLPLSYRAGAMTSGADGGATVSLHFNDMAEAEAWFVAITDQHDAALVDKTANLQDRTAPLSDDDHLRLRSDVARAIWDVMREHEDRCDHALEDVEPKHQVWDCADAAIETALGIIPRPNPLIARREVVAGGPVRVTRLHLTDEGRAALTSKATGPLPPARVDELMAEAGYLGASAESRADFINGLRHGELVHGIKET